jgi:hypothetical protein
MTRILVLAIVLIITAATFTPLAAFAYSGISVIPLANQNTITPHVDNNNNNNNNGLRACANLPFQNKGTGPPFCVGHLVVIKHVINDNGGTGTAKDFTLSVSRSFPGAESPGPAGYTQSLSGDCSGSINAGDNKECTVTNNDNPQTGGPSISVSDVRCTGSFPEGFRIDLHVFVSGISHDAHSVTFQEQVFSPTGYLVRLHEYTIPADAPDPASIDIGEGIFLPPGPTAGTYKIIDIINGQAVSTTFQVPECTQQ